MKPGKLITLLVALFVAAAAVCVAVDGWIQARGTESSAPSVGGARHESPVATPTPASVRATPPEPQPRVSPSSAGESATPPGTGDIDPIRAICVSSAVDGAPICGAAVCLADDDRVVARLSTRDDGCVAEGLPAVSKRVVIEARGFERQVVEAAPEIRVAMRAGASIVGRFQLPDGDIPTERIHVAVRRLVGRALTVDDVRASLRDDPSIAATLTAVDGSFTIDGLHPGATYVVHAGAPGLGVVPTDRQIKAVAGGDPIAVQVAYLYLLHVKFVDSDGLPIRTSERVASMGIMADLDRNWMGTYGLQSAEVGWFGIPRPKELDPFELLTVVASAVDAAELDLVRVGVSIPGYESVSVMVAARRLTSAAQAPTEVHVRRLCAGFGALRIRLSEESAALAQAMDGVRDGGPTASLRVAMRLNDMFSDVVVSGIGVSGLLVEGVPSGECRAAAKLAFGSSRPTIQPNQFELHVGETVEMIVDVPKWSGFEIHPKSEGDDVDYDGPLFVTVRNGNNGASAMRALLGPPYRVVPVDPGDYSVLVAGSGQKSELLSIHCNDKEMADVQVVIRPLEE